MERGIKAERAGTQLGVIKYPVLNFLSIQEEMGFGHSKPILHTGFVPQYPGKCRHAECACPRFWPADGTGTLGSTCRECAHTKETHAGQAVACTNCDGHGNRTSTCPKTEACAECYGRGLRSIRCTETKCRGTRIVFDRSTASDILSACQGCDNIVALCEACAPHAPRTFGLIYVRDSGKIPCRVCTGKGVVMQPCVFCVAGRVWAK